MLQKAHRNSNQMKSFPIVWKNWVSELFHWTTVALFFTFLSRYLCTIDHPVFLLRRVDPPKLLKKEFFLYFYKIRIHWSLKSFQSFYYGTLTLFGFFFQLEFEYWKNNVYKHFYFIFSKIKPISFAITFGFPVGFFSDKGGFPFQKNFHICSL